VGLRRAVLAGSALVVGLAPCPSGVRTLATTPTERKTVGPENNCFDPAPGRTGLAARVADAVAVLRISGHDPAAYQLELRAGDSAISPTLVFRPRADPTLYPLIVRPDAPCQLAWLWDPDRFTPWQVAVLNRARELLALGVAPPAGAELEQVAVVETAETVTVRLEIGLPGEQRRDMAEHDVTLAKKDLRPAGAHADWR